MVVSICMRPGAAMRKASSILQSRRFERGLAYIVLQTWCVGNVAFYRTGSPEGVASPDDGVKGGYHILTH